MNTSRRQLDPHGECPRRAVARGVRRPSLAVAWAAAPSAQVALLSVTPPRRRATTAVVTSVAVLAISQYPKWTAHDDYSGTLDLDPTLKPIATPSIASESPRGFFGSLDALRDRLDEGAARGAVRLMPHAAGFAHRRAITPR